MAKKRVIGLDIGTTHVRAAELELDTRAPDRTASLIRYGEAPVPAGAVRDGEVAEAEVVGTALRELWSQTRFGSRDVVIGVGNQRVLVRELDMPWMPLPHLRASLPFQVQELLPMPVEEALLDYYPTEELTTEQGRTVRGMLVAAARDTVRANLLAVEAAGLRALMVDLNAFALLRAEARGAYADTTVALVDIGARVTNVVIAAKGVPQFIRTLPAGGQDATDAVAAALSVAAPEAEAVKREIGVRGTPRPGLEAAADAVESVTRTLVEAIRNTFVYYASNHPGAGIEIAVLSGGGAHLPGLGQYLSSASRLPVTLADPLTGLRLGKAIAGRFTGTASTAALPIGLAYGVAA